MLDTLLQEQSKHHYDAEHHPGLVYKVGRTTGVTVGQLTGTEVLVREYETTSQASMMTEVTEHVIVSADGSANFARPGDSGALVRSPDNGPVGLFFGAIKNGPRKNREDSTYDQDRPAQVSVYFNKPGVALDGVFLYTPFRIVLESMRATLAEAFGGDEMFELSYVA